jgi:subtilisin
MLAGLLAIGCGVLPAAASKAGPAAPAPSTAPSQNVIVLLKDSVTNSDSVAAEQSKARHARVTQVYGAALQGYAASVPADQIAALQQDPRVEAVVDDTTTRFEQPTRFRKPQTTPPFPQVLPFATDRVDADVSSTKAGDGRGRVDVDVAVIDTGVGPHNDLNVVGGVNCGNSGSKHDVTDVFGHGTGVAGVVGALDNARNYVGVAPGARIWSVKTMNADFNTHKSVVICGIDWVTRHADIIEVVNISIGFPGGSDDHNCGRSNHDPLHRAICRMVASGVTTVVSAGNNSVDAATVVPAAYDEVITVSAMADFDGIPGGLNKYGYEQIWNGYCFGNHDDKFASFSNFGAVVDLIAPGVCVEGLYPFTYGRKRLPNPDGYNLWSGTSFSAPHVAGAAALYKSSHPRATPAEVKAALIRAGNFNYDGSWDPDGIKEPLLNVASF